MWFASILMFIAIAMIFSYPNLSSLCLIFSLMLNSNVFHNRVKTIFIDIFSSILIETDLRSDICLAFVFSFWKIWGSGKMTPILLLLYLPTYSNNLENIIYTLYLQLQYILLKFSRVVISSFFFYFIFTWASINHP